ncbi:uncharacterized protein LOC128962317 [Oppia nitens]|uniref:uncharacterized protein LOC128962317 n=1 Tax=Oppia nitens TaxID=1686743 RepID=UPI0023DAD09B|nr:uncharacterized protein LOC128962317 [Oppia nitens]
METGDQSDCGQQKQILHLVFDDSDKTRLQLWFTFERDQHLIKVTNITLQYRHTVFTNTSNQFETPVKYGYKCFAQERIDFDGNTNSFMNISNVRLEAFRTTNYFVNISDSDQWEREGLKCDDDRIGSDAYMITGISVGCGVAMLTVITLVAIWSGRQQERRMLKIKMMRQRQDFSGN